MNALEIVQQAGRTLGIENIVTIQDMTNTNTQRLVSALNRALEEIHISHNWEKIVTHGSFTTDPSEDNPVYHDYIEFAGYDFPIMFAALDCFASNYVYDATVRRRINSTTYDVFESNKVGRTHPIVPSFVMIEGILCFYPEVPKDHRITFFYKSKYPVIDTVNRSLKELFTKDSDECKINSQLLLRGLLYKYNQQMGFDYAENYRDYQLFLDKIKDQSEMRRHFGNQYNFEGIPISVVRNSLGEII